MFTIYKATCVTSGKSYVGQTNETVAKRWRRHVNRAIYNKPNQCPALSAAIRKYGKASFKHEVLAVVKTREEANHLESWWIAVLNTVSPDGYNLDYGGGVGALSLETSAKLSAATKRQMAEMTAEERRARARNAALTGTPEERSERARKAWENLSAEERAHKTAKIVEASPPMAEAERQKRSERLKAQWAALSDDERRARCAKMRACRTAASFEQSINSRRESKEAGRSLGRRRRSKVTGELYVAGSFKA